MANPAQIITTVEGLVGQALRLTADTANNVAQAANTWLKTVKQDLRLLDPAATVFVDGITATALTTVSNTSATMRCYGIVCRHQDTDQRWFRAFANPVTVTQVKGQFFGLQVGTRSAANSPTYAFAAFPGGVDIAAATLLGGASISVASTTTETGSSAATDATMWVVYST